MRKKNVFIGFLGSVSMLIVYFLVMGLLSSVDYAFQQFKSQVFWFIALSIGFGIQLTLFSYIKETSKSVHSKKSLYVNGGVSTGTMLICCLHHLVDVIPVIGISALSVFMVQYQTPFMMLGVLFNVIGIFIMLSNIKKYGLYSITFKKKILEKIDFKKVIYSLMVIGSISIGVVTVMI